jgi:hypothetical protein
MANDERTHTFRFTVSGLNLADETKEHIASEFAAIVTRHVVAENPTAAEGEIWSLCRINGGRMIGSDAALAISAALGDHPALAD